MPAKSKTLQLQNLRNTELNTLFIRVTKKKVKLSNFRCNLQGVPKVWKRYRGDKTFESLCEMQSRFFSYCWLLCFKEFFFN